MRGPCGEWCCNTAPASAGASCFLPAIPDVPLSSSCLGELRHPRRRPLVYQLRGTDHLGEAAYQQRNHVERTVNRLKGWRRMATRYEKREVNYLAMVTIAAIVLLWLE